MHRRPHMRFGLRASLILATVGLAAVAAACGSPGGSPAASTEGRKDIVVTYSVLGAS